jgi:predicted acyltransferase
MNSIAAYCIAHLFENFIGASLTTHFGSGVYAVFGTPFVPLVRGAMILFMMWLILLWMHRRKIFLRI